MLAAALFMAAVAPLGNPGPGPVRIDVGPGDSLVKLCERIRSMPAAEKSRGVDVVFAPGEYFLPSGLGLTPADGGVSNAPPVVWRSAKPGAARIAGARRIPVKSFSKVTDPAILARLPEEGRGKVYSADVSEFCPSDIPDLAPAGIPGPPYVFMDGALGTMARWPNGGEWMTFTQRVDKGENVSKTKWACYSRGAFVCSDPRLKRWDFSKGVWMNGYFTHDWSHETTKVLSFGPENGTNDVVRLEGPISYGVLAGTWGRKYRRFRAFNILEELDMPGEWYLDRKAKILYIVPPGGVLSDGLDVRLSFSRDSLLRGTAVGNMRFEGLEFACNYGGFLFFRKASDMTFSDCRFFGTVKDCASFDYGRRVKFLGCEIAHCGMGGIKMYSAGDRPALKRADSVVENCRIHDYAMLRRTYSCAIEPTGCGFTIRGNEIWDAPHMAMRFETNDTLIESNNVHHVLLETGDAGAFYSGRDWTTQGNVLRYNFMHDIGPEVGGGGQSHEEDAMAFYFDDCDCGDVIYGNVFHNVPRGIMIGGGRDHPVRGNIFSRCRIGLSIDTRGLRWKEYCTPGADGHLKLEAVALRMGYTNALWSSRYPRLANIMNDHPCEPRYDPVENNLFIDCTKDLLLIREAFKYDASEVAPGIVSRLAPVRGNVVVNSCGTNGVRTAVPFSGVANGFLILNGEQGRPFDTGAFNPSEGAKTGRMPPAGAAVEEYCRAKFKGVSGGELVVEPGGLTPQAALARIRAERAAGDKGVWTVRVKKGMYVLREPLVFLPSDSGTEKAPFEWIGEQGAVFTGGVRIKGWKDEGGGVWSAPVPRDADGKLAHFEQLWVNGRRADRARLPDSCPSCPVKGYFPVVRTSCETVSNDAGAVVRAIEKVTLTNEAAKVLFSMPQDELAEAQMLVVNNWTFARRILRGLDPASMTVETHGPDKWAGWQHWRPSNTLVYFENVRSAFDSPGEWFYDAKAERILYRPLPREKMARAEVVAPSRFSCLVEFKGEPGKGEYVHDIVLRGIAFEHSAAPSGKGVTVGPTESIQFQAAFYSDALLTAEGAKRVVIDRCAFAHTGNYAIRFYDGCISNAVLRCTMRDLGAGGVCMGARTGYVAKNESLSRRMIRKLAPRSTAFNRVEDCTIHNGGRFNPEGVGVIFTHASDSKVLHCDIYDFYYTGVSLGWVWGYSGSTAQRNEVAFNRIYDLGKGVMSDLGGVYTLGTSFGTRIHHNLIRDLECKFYGAGALYTDQGSEGITMDHNLCLRSDDSGFVQHYGSGCEIRNNIFAMVKRKGAVSSSRREAEDIPNSFHFLNNIVVTRGVPLVKPRTLGVGGLWACNLWYDCSGNKPNLANLDWDAWTKCGKEIHGVYADPLFENPDADDFRLKPGSPAFELGFDAWDYSSAGVRPAEK